MTNPPTHAATAYTQPTRFVVGIDLGTTNTAVSYVDMEEARELLQFRIPQLVSAGELADADLLPSFCYLPAGPELPEGALELPWDADPQTTVGLFARNQGAAVPERLIASAKSWLAHAGVDRTRGILPWGGHLDEQALSPIQVSSLYLGHVRAAWDHRFGALRDADGTPCTLSEQHVIVTVPASFDETARELTLRAAHEAGLPKVTLIEEPLAAFYAWLWANETQWQDMVVEGDSVLVLDVGGGTTDFSMVEIEPGFTVRRTAVGDHLLLGGDNMDMALARRAEAAWQTRLPPREWSMLCQECRRIKELLLSPQAPESADIAVAGTGSGIVATTRVHTFRQDEVLALVRDGFFPCTDADAPDPVRSRGIREMGLPYAADPAVTHHLLRFLRLAGRSADGTDTALACPSRILFNGGAMLPEALRMRVRETVANWCGADQPIPELPPQDLNLAVSRGAAYYGLVRRGEGVRVRGGIARSYYLEIGHEDDRRLVCVMPRDTNEGVVQKLDHAFQLRTNQPVRFPIAASATRLGDRLGDVLESRDEITELPPLHTVIQHGRKGVAELGVTLAAMLNEIGTLELWCTAEDGTTRYPLSFDLRGEAETEESPPETLIDDRRREHARQRLQKAFCEDKPIPKLTVNLEQDIGLKRSEWGLQLLRHLADELLDNAPNRLRTPQHEARWLNLTGFSLRPGFGAAGDDWRLRLLWKLWHGGAGGVRNPQVAAEWWTCWRRVAGGLRAGHQQQVANALLTELVARRQGERLGPRKRGVQEAMEMWRCLGALERIPVKAKLRVLRTMLLEDHRLEDHHWWVVARMGARRLFHGSEDAVIPAERLQPLLEKLLERLEARKPSRMALFAAANLCRLCGVRGLDVDDATRVSAAKLLADSDCPKEWTQQLSEVVQSTIDYQAVVTGDRLPLGLTLRES